MNRVFIGVASLVFLFLAALPVRADLPAAEWKQLQGQLMENLENRPEAIRVMTKMKKADSDDAVKFLLSLFEKILPAVEKDTFTLTEEAEKQYKYQEMIFKANSHTQGDVEKLKKVNDELNALELKLRANRDFLNKFSEVIGAFTNEAAVDELMKKGLDSKRWQTQEVAAKAFTYSKVGKGREKLEALVTSEDTHPDVVHAAVRALGNIGDIASIPVLAALADRVSDWEMQLEIVYAYKAMNDMRCVPGLLSCMKDATKRVKHETNNVLAKITGENFHGNAAAWSAWYEKNKEAIDNGTMAMGMNADKPEASAVTYHGIPVISDRIVFIVDRSGSMKEPYTPSDGGNDYGEPPAPGSEEKTRWTVVRDELIKTIEMLQPDVIFTIITYSSEFDIWTDKMVAADAAAKTSAIAYLKSKEPEGATNIFDPMEKAFEIAGALIQKSPKKPKKRPKGVASGDPADKGALIDTIFLLSDGEPNAGRIPQANDILPAIADLNENLNVVINTIYVGKDPSHFMQKLAEDNHGTYVQK